MRLTKKEKEDKEPEITSKQKNLETPITKEKTETLITKKDKGIPTTNK